MTLYLAAPYAARDRVAAIAHGLRAAGHTVTSTWHEGPAQDERALPVRDLRAAWERNSSDLDQAERLFVFAYLGDGLETWCEVARWLKPLWFNWAPLVLRAPGQRVPLTASAWCDVRECDDDDDAAIALVLRWLG